MFKRKIYFIFISLLYILSLTTTYGQEKNIKSSPLRTEKEIHQLYTHLNLENQLDFEAFKIGYLGFKSLHAANPILTIADFSKASTKERFFVIDLLEKKLLYTTHVAHGRNSGENYATKFSNKVSSYQSSPGFYKTAATYFGGNGYSLRLKGLEKGINDKAMERAIVIHGADYANPKNIASKGRLGRSLGCPALPQDVAKPIIDSIKDGSILYIHVNNKEYTENSHFLRDLLS